MNLTDLPELMDERYETDAVPVLAESRIDGVRRKVAAARRRQVAGTFAAVVLLAAGAVTGVAYLPRGTTGRVASPSPIGPVAGFPEWANGGHLLAADEVRLRKGATISLTVTPERLALGYEMRCSSDATVALVQVFWTVNGHQLPGGSCAGNNGSVIPNEDVWARYGLRPGHRATFTATVIGAIAGPTVFADPGQQVPMPKGTLAAAVRQRVPFDEYQFPPRPDPLPTLDTAVVGGGHRNVHLITSDPGDPDQPRSVRVTWPAVGQDVEWLTYQANSQTPGFLHLFVDGKPLGTAEFWTYYDVDSGTYRGSLSAAGIERLGVDFRPGDTFTFTVAPEHMTGAWEVGLDEPDV
ncbi:MAG TPA: hypothetical protein VKB69_04785 [Micromonosporaceae bacterium]|nr:hypothetical protein [Micromonosporaceae bacterium]